MAGTLSSSSLERLFWLLMLIQVSNRACLSTIPGPVIFSRARHAQLCTSSMDRLCLGVFGLVYDFVSVNKEYTESPQLCLNGSI
ncbi:hypothetical protein EDD18DRAFT_725822 [Armillaria luteobubalina]|uniref:Secreted protein n=1 Tax=Armillaria luteobubalina TaxID=153913 RepID=A0AA39ULV5_9AGAR|nr:hypothetical protein EDD18DRAFT_725822 [Armillaria luteobubalina]